MSTKQYNEDRKQEREVTNTFLEKYIHPELIRLGIADGIELTDLRARQINGVDAIYKVGDQDVLIDYKTRYSMTNKWCDKLAVELRAYDVEGQKRFNGWGINPHQTNYWAFIHILDAADGTKGAKCPVTPDNIRKVKLELIRPDEFHKWLSFKNWTPKTLEEKAIEAEERFKTNSVNCDDPKKAFKLRQNFYDEFKYYAKWEEKEEDRIKYNGYISVSAGKYDEDPTNFVIDEYVADRFDHSRRFIWEKEKGLREVEIKGHKILDLKAK